MPGPITVFSARKIITMDAAVDEATHVAVRDGIIIEVGDLDDCAAWGPYTLDKRFDDGVLMPGFIESHAHLLEGLLWAKAEYAGPVDRRDPSGRLRKGINNVPDLVRRLKEIEATLEDGARPLVAWGIDPSLNDPIAPITRHDLDKVSSTRAMIDSARAIKAALAGSRVPLVINDRVDHFIRPPNSGKPDNHFAVTGVFLVRDGKILYWADYRSPDHKT